MSEERPDPKELVERETYILGLKAGGVVKRVRGSLEELLKGLQEGSKS